MYFFHCEETRPLVSIFTYIDAMLLNLEVQVPQQMKRKFVNLSVLKVLKFFKKFPNSKIIKKKKKNSVSKFQQFHKI
jgi:Holliday junction resolvase